MPTPRRPRPPISDDPYGVLPAQQRREGVGAHLRNAAQICQGAISQAHGLPLEDVVAVRNRIVTALDLVTDLKRELVTDLKPEAATAAAWWVRWRVLNDL